MRLGVIFAATVALASLAVHLWVPFAIIEADADTGSQTLSRWEMADRLGGDELGAVPGASMGYLLAGAIVMACAGIALLVGLSSGAAGRWSLFGGAIAAALGAAMSLHANALWIGRGVAGWIHSGITGAPTPAPAHDDLNGVASSDVFWSIQPISPFILAALSVALLVLLARVWPQAMQQQRGIQEMARRHGRIALLGAAAILLTATVPWVVQELPDAEGAQHHYFWSAYDIMQKREAGLLVAAGTGEAGIIPWDGLAVVLQAAFVFALIGVMAPWLGMAGRHLESMGQAVFGRLLENVSLASIVVYAFLIVAGFLGSFVLQDPTDFQGAVTTALPLTLAALGLAGLIRAGLMARHVLAVDQDIVADDFPEPVIYD